MPLTSPPMNGMTLEDFRRLGVRPNECRLAVIRRAALRSSRVLAQQHLTSPSHQVELQLSRVATSAYRLLDPRQRRDPVQRAHVGRILPNTLSWAGQTNFSSDASEDPEIASLPDGGASDAELIEMLNLDAAAPAVASDSAWTLNLRHDHALPSSSRSRVAEFRRWSQPWVLLAIAGLAVGTFLGLATLNRTDVAATHRMIVNPPRAPVSDPMSAAIQPQPSQDPMATRRPDIDDGPPSLPAALEPTLEFPRPTAISDASISDLDPRLSASGEPLAEPSSPAPVDGSEPGDLGSRSDRSAPATVLSGPQVGAGETRVASAAPVLAAGPDGFLPDPFSSSPTAVDDPPEMSELTRRDPISSSSEISAGDGATSSPAILTAGRPGAERHPVPDDASLRAARQQLVLLVPQWAQSIPPREVDPVIARIESLRSDSMPPTADHWVTQLAVAQLAWANEDLAQIRQRLSSLPLHYETSLLQPVAESFVAACRVASLPATQSHLTENGFRLADQLLCAGSVDSCRQVIDVMAGVVAVAEQPDAAEYLQQFRDAAGQMQRLGEAADRMLDDAGMVIDESADLGIVGRYYCLMLRRWDVGLPWLVDVSNSRIASVAREEIQLGSSASAEDRISLSQRWLQIASRSDGRASDSMRLHAVDILRSVIAETSGLKKLEAQRKTDEALADLPPFLRDASGSASGNQETK